MGNSAVLSIDHHTATVFFISVLHRQPTNQCSSAAECPPSTNIQQQCSSSIATVLFSNSQAGTVPFSAYAVLSINKHTAQGPTSDVLKLATSHRTTSHATPPSTIKNYLAYSTIEHYLTIKNYLTYSTIEHYLTIKKYLTYSSTIKNLLTFSSTMQN
jgi:hypothetical protein